MASHTLDRFIHQVRVALYDDRSPGFVEDGEMAEALKELQPAQGLEAEVAAEVAQDLLYRSMRPRWLGGVPMTAGSRGALAAFVGAHDVGKPGVWLDPPKNAGDGLSSFVSRVRADASRGRRIRGETMRRALQDLERAPVSDGVKAHFVEGLLLASDANHGQGIPVDSSAARQLTEFRDRVDPKRQGLGWFEEPKR